MKHVIIGTAGHIDHGKTALVRALTGIDADRLKEEKLRGITIDLGFAHLLDEDLQVGFIDVPGHERFVHNMLAGIGGIDYVLLVVAADESIMPQTREHFDICRLLGIHRGAVVITKTDVVDAELLELVESEIEEFVKSSFLENAPHFRVSAKTGEGIDELRSALPRLVSGIEDRSDHRSVRLPVDRVFSVRGFGTVVTGTLLSGSLQKDREVEFLPGPRRARIRNLQCYGQPVNEIEAGQRAAVNVQGLEVSQLWRGMVLAEKDAFAATPLLDVRIEMLESSPMILKDLSRVHLHLGTHELIAKVVLLKQESLKPGDTGFAQLRLEQPAVCAHGDRFIIRRFSPLVTIGGGVVLHSHPPKLRRRNAECVSADPRFETADEKTKLRMDIEWAGLAGRSSKTLGSIFGFTPSTIRRHLESLAQEGAVVLFNRNPLSAVSRTHVTPASEKLVAAIREFHVQHPLAAGIAKEELRQRVFKNQGPDLFNTIIQELLASKKITQHDDLVGLYGREVTLSEEEIRLKADLEQRFQDAGFSPPRIDEILAAYGKKDTTTRSFFHMLLREGRLVRISDDIVLHTSTLDSLQRQLRAGFPSGRHFTVGEFKDVFGLTRKFAIPILEYLDRRRITRRVGDERVLLDKNA